MCSIDGKVSRLAYLTLAYLTLAYLTLAYLTFACLTLAYLTLAYLTLLFSFLVRIKYSFPCCFVKVWNLVAHIEGV